MGQSEFGRSEPAKTGRAIRRDDHGSWLNRAMMHGANSGRHVSLRANPYARRFAGLHLGQAHDLPNSGAAEIESFTKVISRGVAGTGPAWFEVRTKSGQVMEFGNSADSRILAQGKPSARTWAVNKVADTKGNYYSVNYVNDAANGEAYPSRIDYTGNAGAGLSPYNSVRFVYDAARPDATTAYHAGSAVRSSARMSKVQTYAGAALVSDYRLTFAQSASTTRSQVTSVTICDGTGLCLPSTTLTFDQTLPGSYSLNSHVNSDDTCLQVCGPLFAADVNGTARLI